MSNLLTCQITIGTEKRPFLTNARWCNSFWSRFRGFTFHPKLGAEESLVLVEKKDSKANTAIHMMFVPFDLGVVWVNDAGIVVDKVVAESWKPHYAPQAPARYVIECHPDKLSEIAIGDTVHFNLAD